MAITADAFNLMLDGLAPSATHVSAHTADPGTSGASEVADAGYARQSVTWNAAASANLDSSNQPVFSVTDGSVTVTHIGLWTAATGGTFLSGQALSGGSKTIGPGDTLTVTDLDFNLNNA